ncbi:HAD-IB family hydrolase [Lujinxingia litoralis]|uniref:HAD-IB family hydrolase n=1 Tax=Lujinxingia litoralis TaxID=2211119 RepID=A0A328CBD0_9DELT|nr:HAD-IB family hydrolase [Lujinxingia litoralis]RAL25492.1 HAD-IB family hydrolase [Lujinxingia litoralis]
MTESPGRPAAFFDLDRTLIRVNSAFLYAKHERRAGRISKRQFLKASAWMALYHLSVVDIERAFAEAVRHYRGQSADELHERTRVFFDHHVLPTVQPGSRAALEHHRSQDHPLVLLTASSPFLSKLAAEHWELDAWLSNQFPIDEQGLLCGTFERPICYGKGKVHHAEHWARQAGVDLDASYFYTDSYSDLPMLRRVGHPRVVNPDPRLRKEALRRGWTIEDWSRPGL